MKNASGHEATIANGREAAWQAAAPPARRRIRRLREAEGKCVRQAEKTLAGNSA